MWHLYLSWTNVTEKAKWSTTGFLFTVPVSYQSNQWWELQQSSIKPYIEKYGFAPLLTLLLLT